MATLIPNISLSAFRHESERHVAEQLIKCFDDNALVYHSYEWLKNADETLHEGEIDFIIIHPEKGILVLEVKGGSNIKYDVSAMQWYRAAKEMKDPFTQVRKNTHKLVDILNVKLSNVFFTYGYAVVFPHCQFFGSFPAAYDRNVLVTIDDMQGLEAKLEHIFNLWQKTVHQPLTVTQMQQIRKVLEGEFRLAPVLSSIITIQEEQLVKLTDEQCRVLDMLAEHKRALIKGVAGSGKTMMAMLQARRFVDNLSCTNVLFVCYNKGLAESLRLALPQSYQSKIHVLHFHDLCKQYTEKHIKIHFTVPTNSEEAVNFWQVTAPSYLIRACEQHNTPKFDAIVVDEGQDFEEFWWYALEKASESTEIPFYIFYDPAQNLYINNQTLPNFGNPISLHTNCRNTKHIIMLCNQLLSAEIKPSPWSPNGDTCEVILTRDTSDTTLKIKQSIQRLLTVGRLKNSQIAILGPNTQSRSSLSSTSSIHNQPVTNSYAEWRQGRGIYYSTIRSFKGLEADVIVLIDFKSSDWSNPAGLDNIHSLHDLYVGISRAKHHLIVVTADSTLAIQVQQILTSDKI